MTVGGLIICIQILFGKLFFRSEVWGWLANIVIFFIGVAFVLISMKLKHKNKENIDNKKNAT